MAGAAVILGGLLGAFVPVLLMLTGATAIGTGAAGLHRCRTAGAGLQWLCIAAIIFGAGQLLRFPFAAGLL